jgi:hypothetical protein
MKQDIVDGQPRSKAGPSRLAQQVQSGGVIVDPMGDRRSVHQLLKFGTAPAVGIRLLPVSTDANGIPQPLPGHVLLSTDTRAGKCRLCRT